MIENDYAFDAEPNQKAVALDLYSRIKNLPIVSPHGHIDPGLFCNPQADLGNPTQLLVQPDHYLLRLLVSQGLKLDRLLNDEPRVVWQSFADHFFLFRGTPTGLWFNYILSHEFNINERLDSSSAQSIYDQVQTALSSPEFKPRTLFERMNIEVLATTDAATSPLTNHQAIRASGWSGKVIPTFRADSVIDLLTPNWQENIRALSSVSGIEIGDFKSFILALEQRRVFFKSLGATATDTSVLLPQTKSLSLHEAETIFQRALKSQATSSDASRFTAQMLMEMARMSVEDGLVMQLHAGIMRNHSPEIFSQFGPDRGYDIPVRAEFTYNLKPLLDRFGNSDHFRLILFTLDESLYSRELAPLAGVYPALRLGPPWWFNDSLCGINRYFNSVFETAGLYNTTGFCDDVRCFLAIPARHDVWRRASANWLAGLTVRHLINQHDAEEMAFALAVGLSRNAYHLE
jgi:glucuronate isomerase